MASDKIVYSNEYGDLHEVQLDPGDTHAPDPRPDRVVINLTHSHIEHTDHGSQTTTTKSRQAGTVIEAGASHHAIKNISSEKHVSLVWVPKP